MAVTIQQLTISQFRRFRETRTFEFATSDEGSGLTTVTGMNGAGKTTIFDALRLCLYGTPETDPPHHYVTHDLIHSLAVGETESADLGVVLSGASGQQYRIIRSIRAVMTPRGPENDIEEATVDILEDGDWMQAPNLSVGDVLECTLPETLEPVVFHDGETSLGISEEWVESIDIVELAAIVQETSRNYPGSTGDQAEERLLSQEKTMNALLEAANGYFLEVTFRDEVKLALGSDGETPTAKIVQEDQTEYIPSADDQMIASMSFLLAFIEILPVTPPLVFDSVLCRMNCKIREKMLNLLTSVANDGQVILMSLPRAIENLPKVDISIERNIDIEIPDFDQ